MFHLTDYPSLTHYFKNKELDELYASVFLSSLAASLIAIFVPVYLLQLDFGFKEIIYFYLVHYVIQLLFFPSTYRLTNHVGVKKLMILGTVLTITYYLLLNNIVAGVPYLFPAAVSGFAAVFYWAGFNLRLAHSADKNKEGQELSLLQALTMVAVTSGPLLGAFFIISESFQTTFYLVAILQCVSLIPLLFSKDHVIKQRFHVSKALRYGTYRSACSYYAEGVGGLAGAIFWPLFIFLAVENVVSLGGIITFTSVLMIFFVLWLGNRIDKNPGFFLKLGVWTHAPVWISRLFFLTPIGLFINNLLSNITGNVLVLPFRKLIYQRAGNKNPSNALYFREFHLSIGRIGLLICALISLSFTWVFFAAFITTFFYLLPLNKE